MEEKELISKVYEIVELARETGKIKKGTNETTKALEKGIAKLAVVARDANPPEVTMHLKPLCKEKNVPYVEVPSKDELGAAAGLQIATVSIVVLQEGEAKKTMQMVLANLSKE
ncbi:50S ribosomal protein L7ae [Candidatus Woesearchaeota archaeon]|nr:50S ribosomal protein L7ae [Candidatus Woesearchaeota archaeon]